ncbi:DUF4136 domain-containing protein [Aequorivita sp. CIP111184]|uniref:DUF4136 domain-containing protein n=1 Tax=Aequorivita sp. CIP111184 TaxID=2211356 RepID=UPI000DBC1A64|nr:DUF4136 domain-containing protein [Aequorivita sp. CIP111184]SRX54342.1 hypothetical protein AEQU1_01351 [Aequorivita sp. CIP111184]
MKILGVFLLLFIMVSCATTVGVEYDYDTNFSNYKTYSYNPEMDSHLSPSDDKLIEGIADKLLPTKNFVKSETPQVYINFYVNEKTVLSKNTVTVVFVPIGKKVHSQEFNFEIIDSSNNKVLWKAVAKEELKLNASLSEKEKYYTELLQEILIKYPPKNNAY